MLCKAVSLTINVSYLKKRPLFEETNRSLFSEPESALSLHASKALMSHATQLIMLVLLESIFHFLGSVPLV